jgi:hypothetical protein
MMIADDLFNIQYIRSVFARSQSAWQGATTACQRFNRFHTPLIQWIQEYAPEFHSLVFDKEGKFRSDKFTAEERYQLIYLHARNAKHPKDNLFPEDNPDHAIWESFFMRTHKRRLVKKRQ